MLRFLKDMLNGKNNEKKKDELPSIELTNSLKDNIAIFKNIFDKDDTIIYRNFETSAPNPIKCSLIFADGMINKEIINENILLPMMRHSISEDVVPSKLLGIFIEKIIISDDIKKSKNVDESVGSVLYGDTIMLVEGLKEVLILNTKGWNFRSISEPSSELIVKGPREGFIESILINTSLIRRKIKNPSLKFEYQDIGEKTKTKVSICYIEDLVNKEVLKEVKNRLEKIDIDGILDVNYIEELISDAPYSPFETTGYTERPDVIAGKLLEGRVAILVDGTPVVITVPFIFMEYFQSNQDYYNNYLFSSFNRILRYLSFIMSISIPAVYLSLVTFHQEMIPTRLILSIAAARHGVPFPTIIEIIAMLLVFDILREGGVRLPAPVGAAISIAGALVLGEAAVSAKFVSAPMVIVISLTGIASFLIYPLKGGMLHSRFFLLLFSCFLGLYGYMFGIIALFIHLISIRSFGVPYMSNLASLSAEELKDTAIRTPWWYMKTRPNLISNGNKKREDTTSPNGKELEIEK